MKIELNEQYNKLVNIEVDGDSFTELFNILEHQLYCPTDNIPSSFFVCCEGIDYTLEDLKLDYESDPKTIKLLKDIRGKIDSMTLVIVTENNDEN